MAVPVRVVEARQVGCLLESPRRRSGGSWMLGSLDALLISFTAQTRQAEGLWSRP